MSSKQVDKVKAGIFKFGKQEAAVRFAIAHAGSGRSGAPKVALTTERKAEFEAKLEDLGGKRGLLRKHLEATEGRPSDEADDRPSAAEPGERRVGMAVHTERGGRRGTLSRSLDSLEL